MQARGFDARRRIVHLRRLQHRFRQFDLQRREKQVHLEGHFQAARLQQFLILMEQAQGGIGGTIRQSVQIMGQAEQGAADGIAPQGRDILRLGQLAQELLQFGAEHE